MIFPVWQPLNARVLSGSLLGRVSRPVCFWWASSPRGCREVTEYVCCLWLTTGYCAQGHPRNDTHVSRQTLVTAHAWSWWWRGHKRPWVPSSTSLICLLSFSLSLYLFWEQSILGCICSPSREPISIEEKTPLINPAHLRRSKCSHWLEGWLELWLSLGRKLRKQMKGKWWAALPSHLLLFCLT